LTVIKRKSKPWKLASWKKKRGEYLNGKSCEWCGSTKNLQISHKNNLNIRRVEREVFHKYYNHYLKDENNSVEIKKLEEKAWEGYTHHLGFGCPSCGSGAYYSRSENYCNKHKAPMFRCLKCKSEFKQPASVKKAPLSTKTIVRRRFQSLFKIKHREELSKIVSERIQKSDEKYHSFENVMVQCKSCHFAYHKGMHLCPKCKKKYVKPKYKICYACLRN